VPTRRMWTPVHAHRPGAPPPLASAVNVPHAGCAA
jgi:hypothetical protein